MKQIYNKYITDEHFENPNPISRILYLCIEARQWVGIRRGDGCLLFREYSIGERVLSPTLQRRRRKNDINFPTKLKRKLVRSGEKLKFTVLENQLPAPEVCMLYRRLIRGIYR